MIDCVYQMLRWKINRGTFVVIFHNHIFCPNSAQSNSHRLLDGSHIFCDFVGCALSFTYASFIFSHSCPLQGYLYRLWWIVWNISRSMLIYEKRNWYRYRDQTILELDITIEKIRIPINIHSRNRCLRYMCLYGNIFFFFKSNDNMHALFSSIVLFIF